MKKVDFSIFSLPHLKKIQTILIRPILNFCRCPLPEKEALMFIWNGENIDRYFCNEEMAFANRSHPVPDVGTCLAFKSLKPPSPKASA